MIMSNHNDHNFESKSRTVRICKDCGLHEQTSVNMEGEKELIYSYLDPNVPGTRECPPCPKKWAQHPKELQR